jgi:inosine-uridine nucleoside N-ribohydrolase
MARKVIIDCDPGIDDALALTLALYDPRLEVIAVTAVEGQVSARQASLNVQAIIEQIDPPRYPRIGVASPCENSPGSNGHLLHGADGLGNAGFAVSELHRQHPAEKIIGDEVHAAPNEVTIIALGPLTNVARAFQRDAELLHLVDRIIIAGGSLNGVGDVTASAEFNMFFDPPSASAVFRSPTTKTLVPLDVTRQVTLTLGLMEELPSEECRIGAFLRKILPYYFRAHRQHLAQESIHVHAAVALLAAVQPELFETIELGGDVETRGDLTTGVTVFDRRTTREQRRDMEVALEIHAAAAADCIVRGLKQAGKAE